MDYAGVLNLVSKIEDAARKLTEFSN